MIFEQLKTRDEIKRICATNGLTIQQYQEDRVKQFKNSVLQLDDKAKPFIESIIRAYVADQYADFTLEGISYSKLSELFQLDGAISDNYDIITAVLVQNSDNGSREKSINYLRISIFDIPYMTAYVSYTSLLPKAI